MSEPGEGLPSGYESTQAGPLLTFTPREIPWLKEDRSVPLVRVDFRGGGSFYMGSLIKSHPKLMEAADQLDQKRKRIVDNLFYSSIPTWLAQSYHPYVKTMVGHRTEKPIYVAGNKSGQRVYFIRTDNIEGTPVIIRLSVCDKAKQRLALSVLTGKSITDVKRGHEE